MDKGITCEGGGGGGGGGGEVHCLRVVCQQGVGRVDSEDLHRPMVKLVKGLLWGAGKLVGGLEWVVRSRSISQQRQRGWQGLI